MNGLVVQISAFGPVHETGSFGITPTIVCETPSSVSARTIRDHSDIGAFLFLRQKCAAANRAQAEHIEPIRCRLEDRNLKRIAESGHRRGDTILTSKAVEDGLPIAEMHETRCGNREINSLLFEVRKDVKHARRFSKRQPAQEKIVDQTEDGSVQPNPEREREYGEKSEPGRLEQLAKSEAKISHHGSCNVVTLFTFVIKNLTRQPARLDSNNRRPCEELLSIDQILGLHFLARG